MVKKAIGCVMVLVGVVVACAGGAESASTTGALVALAIAAGAAAYGLFVDPNPYRNFIPFPRYFFGALGIAILGCILPSVAGVEGEIGCLAAILATPAAIVALYGGKLVGDVVFAGPYRPDRFRV
jgi:hypothetical protein